MVLPLSRDSAGERWEALTGLPQPAWFDDHALFTCRHWDTDTRRCVNYDSRPLLCRDYPYHDPCQWCGYVQPTLEGGPYKLFDWSQWQWDDAAGGYHPIGNVRGDNAWKGWTWDPVDQILHPDPSPDFPWRWDHDANEWEDITAEAPRPGA